MRDEFVQSVKEKLAKRVGFRCSNPKCRKLTAGPHSDSISAVNIVVAAHIAAAAPGGPRHDPSMTAQQRRAIDNAVWLCQSCAKLVDSDSNRFTVQVLRDWRETAEHLARLELSSNGPAHVADSFDCAHSIRFAIENWRIWRERGTLPGDEFAVISCWRRGDIRYAFRLRLRNELGEEDQIKRLRVEFRADSEILFSDDYAIQPDEIVLPPRKWVTRDISYGLYDQSIFLAGRSVWFSAEGVGDTASFRWHIADYDPKAIPPPACE